jgi:hypothetical protein
MRGRPPGSKNKNPKSDASKDAKRKRHQRGLENAVKLDEFLSVEAKQAREADPGGDPAFFYQNTQPKILGRPFDRVAERLKRKRR